MQSKVDPTEVLATNRFDAVTTSEGIGWLRALRQTKEYGVNSFVYKRRKPFHPKRLAELLEANFYLDLCWESREHAHDHDHDHDHDHEHEHHDHKHTVEIDVAKVEQEMVDAAARKKSGIFNCILRSKGWLWIATRPDMKGSWGHAGSVVRIDPVFPWLAIYWPYDEEDEQKEEIIKQKAELSANKHGDRRQEIVFIGMLGDKERSAIASALDACLVTDTEWQDLARIVVDDPIPLWQMEPFDDWDKYLDEETKAKHKAKREMQM